MDRMARVVVPEIPHHVTQRGNGRQTVFFSDRDYAAYLRSISIYCREHKIEIWAYCLMPNHVHLILLAHNETGPAKVIGEAHHRYTRLINFRGNWKGYLWQVRFASFPMDERHLYKAVRYVELNPVAAGMVEAAANSKWSSARSHLQGENDKMDVVAPMLQCVDDWTTTWIREIH